MNRKDMTLSEYQEHLKQSRYYDLKDEVTEVKCFECDETILECDSVNWQFKHNSKPRIYCMTCFKRNKEEENE